MIFEFLIEQGSKELTQVNLSKNCQKERKTPYKLGLNCIVPFEEAG